MTHATGCSSAWLERSLWEREVAGSNPVTPTGYKLTSRSKAVPTTKVEKLSDTRVKLSISVSPAEFKPSIDHAYQHIAEQVQIKGFRAGKVPPILIDQRVGRLEVLNHAVSEGVDKFFREATEAEKIRTLGRPEIIDTTLPNEKDFSGDLVVVIETDVRPEFELPKYEGMAIKIDEVMVTPNQVEDELMQVRTRFGTLVTVDRPAAKGDFVTLDLNAKSGGKVVDINRDIKEYKKDKGGAL